MYLIDASVFAEQIDPKLVVDPPQISNRVCINLAGMSVNVRKADFRPPAPRLPESRPCNASPCVGRSKREPQIPCNQAGTGFLTAPVANDLPRNVRAPQYFSLRPLACNSELRALV